MGFDELRQEYQGPPFHKRDCHPDPLAQFQRWFDEAVAAEIPMSNAMALATVDKHGFPHARMVLLKEMDERGFVFFTNYQSRKADELAACSRAALLFWWHPQTRQIRVEGEVHRISAEESDQYFHSRPRASNIAAIASAQSRVLESRDVLEKAIAETAEVVGEGPLQRPGFWGGYRLKPTTLEFWQGRPDRSHDRLEYRPDSEGNWVITRLYP